MKAATILDAAFCCESFISIHAAREGGDCVLVSNMFLNNISIHAAREGGDTGRYKGCAILPISIHAAREGGDMDAVRYFIQTKNFNPRRP